MLPFAFEAMAFMYSWRLARADIWPDADPIDLLRSLTGPPPSILADLRANLPRLENVLDPLLPESLLTASATYGVILNESFPLDRFNSPVGLEPLKENLFSA